MELPFNQSTMSTIVQRVKEASVSFLDRYAIDHQSLETQKQIMPLFMVERILHDHYVSTTPLYVTYEFYNAYNRMEQRTLLAYVDSPIQADYSIDLSPVDQDYTLNIKVDHILAVSASIA